MKPKKIILHNPSGWPTTVATIIVKIGVRGRWTEHAVSIGVSTGTGDPRGGKPRSIQGVPRITLTDVQSERNIHINLRPFKLNP